jgi:hypothetical protein
MQSFIITIPWFIENLLDMYPSIESPNRLQFTKIKSDLKKEIEKNHSFINIKLQIIQMLCNKCQTIDNINCINKFDHIFDLQMWIGIFCCDKCKIIFRCVRSYDASK